MSKIMAAAPDIIDQLSGYDVVSTRCQILCGKNSLFNTILNFVSLFDTEKLFLPYPTLCLKFMPFTTLLSIWSLNDVK